MAKVEEDDCRRRHEEERTMYFDAISEVKKASLPRWVFVLALVIVVGVCGSIATLFWARVANVESDTHNNEVTLARIETGVQWIQEEMKK